MPRKKMERLDRAIVCALQSGLIRRYAMDKLGTWLAITGVAIGFMVLGWLLFSDNSSNKKKP